MPSLLILLNNTSSWGICAGYPRTSFGPTSYTTPSRRRRNKQKTRQPPRPAPPGIILTTPIKPHLPVDGAVGRQGLGLRAVRLSVSQREGETPHLASPGRPFGGGGVRPVPMGARLPAAHKARVACVYVAEATGKSMVVTHVCMRARGKKGITCGSRQLGLIYTGKQKREALCRETGEHPLHGSIRQDSLCRFSDSDPNR